MKKQKMPAIMASIGMLILILDTKTAVYAVGRGIDLCLTVLVPSLFPFLFLSAIITATMLDSQSKIFRPLASALGIPEGEETVFFIGLLGGYPVGAQCIATSVRNGSISRENGRRMLSFCSNAGPSFLFGIAGSIFSKKWMCWALWIIHILSAIMVSFCIPAANKSKANPVKHKEITLSEALRKAITTMATISGWVILFRVMLTFIECWILWRFPVWIQVIINGITELANGCHRLNNITDEKLRFILCSAMLGFGGLCVTMQTYSVCEGIDCSLYLPGKVLQTIFSTLLASGLISQEMRLPCILILVIIIGNMRFLQKKIAIHKNQEYNRSKRFRRIHQCFSAKKSNHNVPIVSIVQP